MRNYDLFLKLAEIKGKDNSFGYGVMTSSEQADKKLIRKVAELQEDGYIMLDNNFGIEGFVNISGHFTDEGLKFIVENGMKGNEE